MVLQLVVTTDNANCLCFEKAYGWYMWANIGVFGVGLIGLHEVMKSRSL